jgi:hypothetical protein
MATVVRDHYEIHPEIPGVARIYHIDFADGGVKMAHHFIQETLDADI